MTDNKKAAPAGGEEMTWDEVIEFIAGMNKRLDVLVQRIEEQEAEINALLQRKHTAAAEEV